MTLTLKIYLTITLVISIGLMFGVGYLVASYTTIYAEREVRYKIIGLSLISLFVGWMIYLITAFIWGIC